MAGAPFPSVAQLQGQPAQQESPTWASFAQTLPGNIPDEAYDSLRSKFFYDTVVPALAPKGVNLEGAREEFMKQTERADKASWPRSEMVLKEATAAAVRPVAGPKLHKEMEAELSDTELELQRQGISPGPYQMAGEVLGQAPYWVAGMGAAGAAAKVAHAGKVASKLINTLAGGLIQGAYDSASADDHPVVAGLKGAALGAAGVGVLESAGPLWRYLKGKHPELSTEQAKAVEGVAFGRYDDAMSQMSAEAIGLADHIEDSVAAWKVGASQSTKKVGVPKVANVANGPLKLTVTGADGKPYVLEGTPEMLISEPHLADHLDAGGAIASLDGPPKAVNKFLLLNERLKADQLGFEVPVSKQDPASWVDEYVGPVGRKKVSRETVQLENDTIRQSRDLAEETPSEVSREIPIEKPPIEPTELTSPRKGVTLESVPYIDKPSYAEEGVKYKETPLVHRYQGPSSMLEEGIKGAEIGAPFEKPSVILGPEADRSTLWHENFHGHLTALGIRNDINEVLHDPIVHDIFHGAFDSESKALYMTAPHVIPEEVYAYTASAIRNGDRGLLEEFAAADTDLESVLNWASDKSIAILDKTAEMADSLHKRTLERRVNSVVARATRSLQDIRAQYAHTDGAVDFDELQWTFKEGDTKRFFDTRDDLVSYLEDNHMEPLLSNELIPTTTLPEGVPRFARRQGGFRGDNTQPFTSEPLPGGPRPRAGMAAFSYFFRPPRGWYDTVARRFDMPELYGAHLGMENAARELDLARQPYEATLKSVFTGVSQERRTDFFKHFIAEDKVAIEQELKFTPAEMAKITTFEGEFADKLGEGAVKDLKSFLAHHLAKVVDGQDVETVFEDGSLFSELFKAGKIDARDTDLLRISHAYMNGALSHQIVKPATDELIKISQDPKLWQIAPLLQRDAHYMLGRPDWTSAAVSGVVQDAIDLVNKGLGQANKALPKSMQLTPLEDNPRAAIDKFLLFSYAGSLGFRPVSLIRNASQLFTTVYPVAGNYMFKGLKEAFPMLKEGGQAEAVQQARQYGALINKSNLAELYAGGTSTGPVESKLGKIAESTLNYLTWSDNATRTVSFKAFEHKVLDSIESNLLDPKAFLKESGLWFLPKEGQAAILKEFSTLTKDNYVDFARRMSTKLVEETNWNYHRGGQPGLYKFQLGRLFGQYGTWPLNYIEYGRRFATASDKQAGVQALTRLAVAHGAILAAGHGAGIDTSSWVFTSPASWEGSPIFNLMLDLPKSMGTGPSGKEARTDVQSMFLTRHAHVPNLIPGSLAFDQMYQAITDDDENTFIKMMGFKPEE